MNFSLQKYVRGGWENARGFVNKNFEKIEQAINQIQDPPTFIQPRVCELVNSSSTPLIDIGDFDILHLDRLAENILKVTIVGTPDDGRLISFHFTDDGTPRTIAWGAQFASGVIAYPTTTVASQRLMVDVVWNDRTQLWDAKLVTVAPFTVTPATLARVNDTNVTATLSGTPLTALLQAVTITLGWTGLLGLVRGGTNADLSATGGAQKVLKQATSGAAITVDYVYDTVTSDTTTGATDNWAPTLAGHTLIECTGAAPAFTGLAGGVTGQRVTIKNTGTGVLTFAYNSGSSSAANRFQNLVTGAPTPVASGGRIAYENDGTNWQLIGHEQGAWIAPTFAAGNYTGNVSTWTVTSGEVGVCRYMLRGSSLTLALSVNNSSTGGASSTALQRVVPGGFTAAAQVEGPMAGIDNGTVTSTAVWLVSGTNFIMRRDMMAATTWATSTTSTSVSCVAQFEVT